MIDRLVRIAILSVPLLAAQPVLARDASAKDASAKEVPAKEAPTRQAPAAEVPAAPTAKQPSPGQSATRDRQKTCGSEWRALTDAQKAAQGPKWPQYWSKCNKRLKGGDKA
ncbi:hypothetical protein CIW48_06420 [Methylobacterium sp. P1-11]|uniref:hypothetical protein n=1 Tax=Methylobacterium sp. P1-11 TaxID=2024616 RepID=UPI0011EF0A25|nr:hypothetical protein [Methylobacterium sp. P1-11]KAA0124854.1 hypothetical protein CIW48_06420 [Methylobacterium sp. P1-11]